MNKEIGPNYQTDNLSYILKLLLKGFITLFVSVVIFYLINPSSLKNSFIYKLIADVDTKAILDHPMKIENPTESKTAQNSTSDALRVLKPHEIDSDKYQELYQATIDTTTFRDSLMLESYYIKDENVYKLKISNLAKTFIAEDIIICVTRYDKYSVIVKDSLDISLSVIPARSISIKKELYFPESSFGQPYFEIISFNFKPINNSNNVVITSEKE